jgi:tetratricopeptide (TPR) repeat protein
MFHMKAVGCIIFFFALAFSSAQGAEPSPQVLLQNGRVDDAISKLNDRVNKAQKDAEAHHLLSRAYLALSDYDKAIREGERAVELEPNSSDYRLWLGRAYGRKAEHASWFSAASLAGKMRDQFERAVQLNGSNIDARTDLAEFYVEAPSFMGGGKDKAEAQANSIAPKDAATAHWIRAKLAEKDKNYAAAEAEYKAAIADGNRPDMWLSLASFYRRQGRLAEMDQAVNKAVAEEKHPTSSSALFDAASLLIRAGRTPQAANFLTKYLSSKEKVEDAPAFQAHYLLGQIYEKQGDRAAAAREYTAALELAKDYKDAREALNRVGPATASR